MGPANGKQNIAWTTPIGRLECCDSGAVRATLRHAGGNTLTPPDIAGFGDPFLMDFPGFEHGADEDSLEIPADALSRTPLSALAGTWRKAPAAHLAQAMHLAKLLGRACRELNELRPQRFLLSPAQVFLCAEADREHWELAPLPLGSPTLENFAESSPELLAWLTADVMVGAAVLDWGRLIAAALYDCLAGDLQPQDLPPCERIKRLLLDRTGNQARLRSALTQAAPHALEPRAAELAAFLWRLLSPPRADWQQPAQLSRQFDEFVEEFSTLRLAGAWEAERNPRLAVEILNSFARWGPPEEVPWQTIARLRALTGDSAGAAVIHAKFGDPSAPPSPRLITRVRALAAKGREGGEELETTVLRIRPVQATPNEASTASTPPLSEEEFLYLVYADGRWLSRPAEALQLLDREFQVSWDAVIGHVLAARFAAEQQEWSQVSWHCREARSRIQKLAGQGGEKGRYSLAYLDAIDGIAHIRAVAGGFGFSYLTDALVKLQNAWVALREITPGTLDTSLADWFAVLIHAMQQHPDLNLAALSAEAFCQSVGIASRASAPAPSLPWFSEEFVFTE